MHTAGGGKAGPGIGNWKTCKNLNIKRGSSTAASTAFVKTVSEPTQEVKYNKNEENQEDHITDKI